MAHPEQFASFSLTLDDWSRLHAEPVASEPMEKVMRQYLRFGVLLLAILIAVTAWTHNVPKSPTQEDITFIHAMLEARNSGVLNGQAPITFEQEIRIITAVQDAVLAHAPENNGLPMGSPREPKALYNARFGLCYDRSRAIEKALMLFGFEVRHISAYSTDETGSAVVSLLTPQVDSHAVTEVKTARGWLLVDSNARWISLDAGDRPWGAPELKRAAISQLPMPEWSGNNRAAMNKLFSKSFVYLPGLYSRHGQFYPPFTPIPDVNWHDFIVGI